MSRPFYTPILRDLVKDPAVIEEFDHLAARLRAMIDAAILEARGISPLSPTGNPGIEQDRPFYPTPTPDQPSSLLEPTSPRPSVPILPSSSDSSGNDDGSAVTTVPGALTLLHARQGTNLASATPINVDTVLIQGLGALDVIFVTLSLEATGGTVTTPNLYNATEALLLANITGVPNITAGNWSHGTATLRATPVDGTRVSTVVNCLNIGNGPTGTMNGATLDGANDWTLPWTLALRAEAIGAGATFHWKWAVYKLAAAPQ